MRSRGYSSMEIARLASEAHRQRLKVAIDGPAGAGKSTVGRGVAEALNCPYLDTGLMYRAVTWLALQAGIDPDDGTALGSLAKGVRFEIPAGTESWIRANGIDLGDELRSED